MLFKKRIFDFFIFSTLFFNIIDIIVTVKFIKFGGHDEANPFMKIFLSMDSVMPFIFFKTLLVCVGLYVLHKKRHKIIAQIGAYFCFCIY